MAIKKHFFDQYIQEQESFNLLRKTPRIHQKYSNNKVFDEPPSLKSEQEKDASPTNGSQTIHENLPPPPSVILNACGSGSQTVHVSTAQEDYTPPHINANGSQTVDRTAITTPQKSSDSGDNGSQTVHVGVVREDNSPSHTDANGSQTVDRMAITAPQKSNDSGDNTSQIVQGSSILSQAPIPQPSENGSQMVHRVSKNVLLSSLHGKEYQTQEQPARVYTLSKQDSQGYIEAKDFKAYSIAHEQTNEPITPGADRIVAPHENISTVSQEAAKLATTFNADKPLLTQQSANNSQLSSDTQQNGSQTVHISTKNHSLQQNGSPIDLQTVHKNTDHNASPSISLPHNGSQNGSQMVHESGINNSRNVPQMVHEIQMVHKPTTEPLTNGSQMVHDFADFSSLPTIQRNILRALWLSAHINGNRTTSRLTLPYIAEAAKVNKKSLKNSIWRLKQKGFLKVKTIKEGRGGWVIYEIPKDIFLEIFTFENGSQTVHKRSTEPITSVLYSSSYINTTTTISATESLSQEWQSIDIDPLKHIGLNSKHILELANTPNVNPSVVQESIYHYAWGETNNSAAYKAHRNPLAILLGVLKKGKAWVESNYKPSHHIALENLIEQRRRQYQMQDELIEQIVSLEFPVWRESLSSQEISKISVDVPSWDKLAIDRALKLYFKREKVIPKLKGEGKFKSFEDNLDKLNA